MLEINGAQRTKLHTALLKAFPDFTPLEKMVSFGLNENLAAIAGGKNLDENAFNLIKWAEAQERLGELVAAARNQNPRNLSLRDVAEELNMAPLPPRREQLERILHRGAGFQDVTAWRERMIACELAICRVEVAQQSFGTGFLVADDLVMTNYHVVKEVIESQQPADKVVLRFDYKAEPDGKTVQTGKEYSLAKDWNVANSPIEQLDYALLRVEKKPGQESVGGQSIALPRRWLKTTAHHFTNNEPLLILQHPQARPLQLAFGAALHEDAALRRVIHDVNTEPGSSGSPCFDSNWNVVALHHYGSVINNRAVPLRLILEDLQSKGMAALPANDGPVKATPPLLPEEAKTAPVSRSSPSPCAASPSQPQLPGTALNIPSDVPGTGTTTWIDPRIKIPPGSEKVKWVIGFCGAAALLLVVCVSAFFISSKLRSGRAVDIDHSNSVFSTTNHPECWSHTPSSGEGIQHWQFHRQFKGLPIGRPMRLVFSVKNGVIIKSSTPMQSGLPELFPFDDTKEEWRIIPRYDLVNVRIDLNIKPEKVNSTVEIAATLSQALPGK